MTYSFVMDALSLCKELLSDEKYEGMTMSANAQQTSPTIETRKADHIRICLEEDVSGQGITPGFERYSFVHQALPEINLRDVDTSTEIWGRQLKLPLLISSMTGGAPRAEEINRNLATAAQELGMAMGVGSQRAAIEHPELEFYLQGAECGS